MANRTIKNRLVRSLAKTSGGKSYTITLPIEIIRRWHWQKHQKVQLEIDDKNKKIIICDWKK
ncbi:MAG: hypothetical protein COU81_02075 [Candidatus Portnoybacteria bacterium CG10_big_fil_rev_8_21_14_0_10_36_7]|uniref:SpoVT-AbrB domain-containing protein n=1 Tax=Candidatus Portnoybacteria bacterium CG10_big_fil_rev_8_21_14_0_10_36_7 TaxID=1974812 RepID=A0A2M8KE28_9BACT|nr:MAG: hypothetical protein COU81_02075 [Candidatus Portnoybacteria bacterium CG10_big_fil_rev_8_21_14_0_10_36_7]